MLSNGGGVAHVHPSKAVFSSSDETPPVISIACPHIGQAMPPPLTLAMLARAFFLVAIWYYLDFNAGILAINPRPRRYLGDILRGIVNE